MVKRRKNNIKKKRNGKGFRQNGTKAGKINASTIYATCTEQLSRFGGLLPLIIFIDFINLTKEEEHFFLTQKLIAEQNEQIEKRRKKN